MKLNNIKHVFFDLDHTLWDFDRNSALAFKEVFEQQKIKTRHEQGFLWKRKYLFFIIINNLRVLLTFEFEDIDYEQIAHEYQDESRVSRTDGHL